MQKSFNQESQSAWFKLQQDELLKELIPSFSNLGNLEEDLRQIRTLVCGISSVPPIGIQEAQSLMKEHQIIIPFKELPDNPEILERIKVSFEPPESVFVVGSWLMQTVCKPIMDVNLVVEMPSTLFKEKDFLNYRYFHIKAFYLCILAKSLKDKYATKFSTLQKENDVLILNDEKWNGFQICISLSINQNVFSFSKLGPSKDLVRKEYCEVHDVNYSNSIIADCFYKNQMERFNEFASDNVKNALILGKHWLLQHGSWISGFEFQSIMLYLLEKAIISDRQESFQIFKACLVFICSNEKLILRIGNEVVESFEDDKFPRNRPVLLEHSGVFDLLCEVSMENWKMLKMDADRSCKILASSDPCSFESIFLLKRDFHIRFDNIFRIDGKILSNLEEILKTALSDRIRGMAIKDLSETDRKLSEHKPSVSKLLVGLLYSDQAFKLVDYGPSIEDSIKAKKFRDFWKDKSELRKFKSGIIHECVVWESLKNSRQSIIEQIIEFACKSHLNAKAESLKEPKYFTHDFKIKSEFELLAKLIKKLELPLNVNQLVPISPGLLGTCFVALKAKTLNLQFALIEFESSNVWPKDQKAKHAIKVIFYDKISKLLNLQGIEAIPTENYVDVCKSDFWFRLLIAPDEISTLQYSHLTNNPNCKSVCSFISNFVHLNEFSLACQYIKNWLQGQMFYPLQLSDSTVDLLVSSLFNMASIYEHPQSCSNALEKFWNLLANWDWSNPLTIVAPSVEEMTETGFASCKVPTLRLCSLNSVELVQINCDFVIWKRLVKLSEICLFQNSRQVNLFKPCLDDFDEILTLNSVESHKTYSPIFEFLKHVQIEYAKYLYVFWGLNKTVGIVWKPEAYEKELFLREIIVLGEGIIVRVQRNQ